MVHAGMSCQIYPVSALTRCVSVTMNESTNPFPVDPDAAVQIMSLTYVPLVYV